MSWKKWELKKWNWSNGSWKKTELVKWELQKNSSWSNASLKEKKEREKKKGTGRNLIGVGKKEKGEASPKARVYFVVVYLFILIYQNISYR